MGRITQSVLARADIAVRRMSHDQKVRLADEIYAQQPTMLASILALPRMVRISRHRGHPFHGIADSVSRQGGHRFTLIADSVSA